MAKLSGFFRTLNSAEGLWQSGSIYLSKWPDLDKNSKHMEFLMCVSPVSTPPHLCICLDDWQPGGRWRGKMELELLWTLVPENCHHLAEGSERPYSQGCLIWPDSELSYFQQPFPGDICSKQPEEATEYICCLRQWIPVSTNRLIKKLYRKSVWGGIDVHRGLWKATCTCV